MTDDVKPATDGEVRMILLGIEVLRQQGLVGEHCSHVEKLAARIRADAERIKALEAILHDLRADLSV